MVGWLKDAASASGAGAGAGAGAVAVESALMLRIEKPQHILQGLVDALSVSRCVKLLRRSSQRGGKLYLRALGHNIKFVLFYEATQLVIAFVADPSSPSSSSSSSLSSSSSPPLWLWLLVGLVLLVLVSVIFAPHQLPRFAHARSLLFTRRGSR